jgi:hypothetical protein
MPVSGPSDKLGWCGSLDVRRVEQLDVIACLPDDLAHGTHRGDSPIRRSRAMRGCGGGPAKPGLRG